MVTDFVPRELPKYRTPKQRWIFIAYESPYMFNEDYSPFNGFFNLTSTYRADSDFLTSYELVLLIGSNSQFIF